MGAHLDVALQRGVVDVPHRDRDLAEHPPVSRVLGEQHVLHLPGLHGPDGQQEPADPAPLGGSSLHAHFCRLPTARAASAALLAAFGAGARVLDRVFQLLHHRGVLHHYRVVLRVLHEAAARGAARIRVGPRLFVLAAS